MRIRPLLLGLAGTAIAVAAAAPMLAPASAAPATATAGAAPLQAIGLTSDQRLVRFNTASPGTTTDLGEVAGLDGDTALIGIDYRVQDNRLYGVGDAGGVYTVRTRTSVATKVSQLTVPLQGTRFGVDFNPAADALRIISNEGQNLRHSVPLDSTTPDVALSYTPPTPAAGLAMAAYTNNDLSVDSGTSLFDIDGLLDQVAVQAPANNGTLSATGKLGLDVRQVGGFDIYTTLGADDRAAQVNGFASLSPMGTRKFALYDVRLLTGQVDLIGHFRPADRVVDLAVQLDQG